MIYNDFKIKWLWKKIDYDWIYGFQCIDLIKQYTKEVHWIELWTFGGSVINGWKTSSPIKDKPYTKILNTPDFVPIEWDIIIFNKTTSNPYWHIGIVNNATNKNVIILEQNGWKGSSTWILVDAIRLHSYDYLKPKCLGFYRKI